MLIITKSRKYVYARFNKLNSNVDIVKNEVQARDWLINNKLGHKEYHARLKTETAFQMLEYFGFQFLKLEDAKQLKNVRPKMKSYENIVLGDFYIFNFESETPLLIDGKPITAKNKNELLKWIQTQVAAKRSKIPNELDQLNIDTTKLGIKRLYEGEIL